ncbi:hypothetical protein LEM8419_02160 [Neolewinella maritima]|uniref:Putative restriction endonuclease domain-containing protein n=2 Tax=Neolewinella maritima TaxID=1383882 RepID=A0ABM9B2C5_9BACT|nr:hypothetical protein LEM8419_02160 [Neolewinella maritima]
MSRSTVQEVSEKSHFHWSLDRYHAAIEAGIFTKNDKVELLFGKLVSISPIGVQHGKVVNKISRLLFGRFPAQDYTIGIQNPITLANDSEPEPDIYLAKGPLEDYDHHPYPADLLLVVEVADSTLQRDRTIKLATYAVAEIEEYWIVNVYAEKIERYTGPTAEGQYGTKETFRTGDTFASLHPGDFAVADLVI